MNFVVKTFDELTKAELYEILRVRSQIFIVELKMCCQEIDSMDFSALHFFLEEDDKILAYLRALSNDERSVKIGRVLSVQHNKGLGSKLMENTMLYLKEKQKLQKICLDSQKTGCAVL